MGRLENKVAVITGAGSGIGAETARRFVAEGARVVVADLRADGSAVAESLGDAARFIQADVSKEADVRAMLDLAVNTWGHLDCLYNNAGFGGALGPIESTSVEDYDLTFDVLLKSVFLGLKHAAPIMKRQRSGSIISTASIAAFQNGGQHLYGVAKLAVVKLTETVALELGEHSVRVNCICPGFIATPLPFGRPNATAEQLDRMRTAGAKSQPLGRVGETSDIAAAALFLASDESSFVTGHALVVDGGMSKGPRWSRWPELARTHKPIRMYRPEDR